MSVRKNKVRCVYGEERCDNPAYVRFPSALNRICVCLEHSEMAIQILEKELADRKKDHEIGYRESLLYPEGEQC